MLTFEATDCMGETHTVTLQGDVTVCSMPEINLYWTRDDDGDHVQYGFAHRFFFGDALGASHMYGECILHANPVDEYDWSSLAV